MTELRWIEDRHARSESEDESSEPGQRPRPRSQRPRVPSWDAFARARREPFQGDGSRRRHLHVRQPLPAGHDEGAARLELQRRRPWKSDLTGLPEIEGSGSPGTVASLRPVGKKPSR